MKSLLIILLMSVTAFAQDVNITLTWDEHPEPDVVEFRVYFGASSGQYTGVASVDINRATIALPRSKMAYIAVTAVNTASLESGHSKEFVYYVKAPGEIRIPGPPTGVKAPKELNSARIEKSNDLRTWVPVYFCADPVAFFRLVVPA